MTDLLTEIDQFTSRNVVAVKADVKQDRISLWCNAYFEYGVTCSPASQKVQRRNIARFITFMIETADNDERRRWTKRLSGQFREYLENATNKDGKRLWSSRTSNTTLAHVKTFAKWITGITNDPRIPFEPFPAGNPMEGINGLPTGSVLEIDRALTPKETNWILDAADELVHVGGRRRDRRRFREKRPPQRTDYRPYRNRAIIYFINGTGARRETIPRLTLDDIDLKARIVRVKRKGGGEYCPSVSKDAIEAIRDYMEQERPLDAEAWGNSQTLFLPAPRAIQTSSGQLSVRTINNIWNEARDRAGIKGTPHCARHAVGIKVLEETGKLSAAQGQLGHLNVATTVSYTRPKREEVMAALDKR